MIDWGGVLSSDEFWLSLRGGDGELSRQLDAGMEKVWHQDDVIADEWMRGRLAAAEVIEKMGISPGTRADMDFLIRRLGEDIAAMRVDTGVAGLLTKWQEQALLVLASDNVYEFADTFERARAGGGAGLSLAGIAPRFEAIICSCETGTLKASFGSGRHFKEWLDSKDLVIDDALLIDDKPENCRQWERHGGTAVRWKLGDRLEDLDAAVSRWLTERSAAQAGLPPHPVRVDSPHVLVTHVEKPGRLQGDGSEFGDPAYMTEAITAQVIGCPQCETGAGLQITWPGSGRLARGNCPNGHQWGLPITPAEWACRKETFIHRYARLCVHDLPRCAIRYLEVETGLLDPSSVELKAPQGATGTGTHGWP